MAKLNITALSRRDKDLMACLVSDEHHTTISSDMSSGEPTVISHYSKDKRYTYAALHGKGKKPYYDDKILMCDDIYIMVASVSPIGQVPIQAAFKADYEGQTFSDLWVADKDSLLKRANLKELRNLHKVVVLALQYGQGAKGLVETLANAGHKITLDQARAFYNLFWFVLFEDVRKLRDRLDHFAKVNGYVITDFGFKSRPEPHKAFNYFIQGSVSSIIDLYCKELANELPLMRPKAIIHDEVVFCYPTEKLDDVKIGIDKAVKNINNQLRWSVPMSFGIQTSSTHYFKG